MRGRGDRQEAIRTIVRTSAVHTQRELVDRLRELGYRCTQATVSRDIGELGLKKLSDGIYVLAEDLHLQRMVAEFVSSVEAAGNLVIVKSMPGTAPGVAAAIDGAELPEVKGSVAGNDTVLVVAADAPNADGVVQLLERLRASATHR